VSCRRRMSGRPLPGQSARWPLGIDVRHCKEPLKRDNRHAWNATVCRRTADALGFANECRHMSRRLSDIFGHSTATTRRHSGTHTRSALRIWLVRCSAAQARSASLRLQPKLHSVVISLSSRSLAHRAGHLPLRTAGLKSQATTLFGTRVAFYRVPTNGSIQPILKGSIMNFGKRLRAGKVKYAMLGWLVGLPLPILLILLFWRGCDF